MRVLVQMWAADSASVCVQATATTFDASFMPWHIPHHEPFPLVSPSSLRPSCAPELGPARPTSAPGLNWLTLLNSGTGHGLTPPMSALGLGSSPPTSKYPRPIPFLRSPALPISCRLSVRPFKIGMTGRVRRHFRVSKLRTHRRSSTAWLHPVQVAPQMARAGCMLLCTPNQGRPPVLPRGLFPHRESHARSSAKVPPLLSASTEPRFESAARALPHSAYAISCGIGSPTVALSCDNRD